MSEKKTEKEKRILEVELFYYAARIAELDKQILTLDELRSEYYYRSRNLEEQLKQDREENQS